MSQAIRELAVQLQAHLDRYRETGVRGVPAGLPIPGSATAMVSELPSRADALRGVELELGACERCRLSRGRKNIVFGSGDPDARIVFVGEGPGADEDARGLPFVGKAGDLLTDIIQKGMKIPRESVYICNVVKCRPPGNRNPEDDEVAACAPFLRAQIAAIGPEVIVALGKFAAQTLLSTTVPISRLRGRWGEFEGVPVMPTFHPAHLLRNPEFKREVWTDIQAVMSAVGLPS